MQIENVITEYGIMRGRDAIYLDKIEFEATHSVKLSGGINHSLVEKPFNIADELNFVFEFIGIISFEMLELDLWLNTAPEIWQKMGSALDKITGSDTTVPGNVHYLVVTYDAVFEIVCKNARIKISPSI